MLATKQCTEVQAHWHLRIQNDICVCEKCPLLSNFLNTCGRPVVFQCSIYKTWNRHETQHRFEKMIETRLLTWPTRCPIFINMRQYIMHIWYIWFCTQPGLCKGQQVKQWATQCRQHVSLFLCMYLYTYDIVHIHLYIVQHVVRSAEIYRAWTSRRLCSLHSQCWFFGTPSWGTRYLN